MGKMESTVIELNWHYCKVVNHYLFMFSGEISNKQCSTFNDMSGPAMISTFNDINKLVQARLLGRRFWIDRRVGFLR